MSCACKSCNMCVSTVGKTDCLIMKDEDLVCLTVAGNVCTMAIFFLHFCLLIFVSFLYDFVQSGC